MTKDSKTSWMTVDSSGTTRQVSVPRADTAGPWRLEGIPTTSAPAQATSQLVIAELTDAGALETATPGAEPWTWFDLLGVDFTHLALLHCIEDGHDPSTPLEPTVERKNPFTGGVTRLTTFDRYVEAFQTIIGGKLLSTDEVNRMAEDGELMDVVVLRVPKSFVQKLAQLPDGATGETARRWVHACSAAHTAGAFDETTARRCIGALRSAARSALERANELLLWSPP